MVASVAATEVDPALDAAGEVRRMRALSHPIRLAILDALAVRQPLTATEAGEIIGENASTCSFHLRQLATYGFVEDAGSPGGRERPWRLTQRDVVFHRGSDRGTKIAAATLESLKQARAVELWEGWQRQAGDFDGVWQDVSPFRSWVVRLTPDEMKAFTQHVTEFVETLIDRPARGHDAVPVHLVAYGHPVALPTAPPGSA